MVDFGTRQMESLLGAGVFHCPLCSAERDYFHKAVREWFTVNFIPVIPIFIPLIPVGKRDEHIECISCGGAYPMDVLGYDPAAEQTKTLPALRGMAILALGEAGRLREANVAALCRAVELAGGEQCTATQVQNHWGLAQQHGFRLRPFAESQRDELTGEAKILAVQWAIRGMRGGGSDLDRQCMAVLRELCQGLMISEDLLRQLIFD
jgi:hypothetical protein